MSRPPGSPKTANSGRKRGSRNKIPAEVRDLARQHTPEALARLVDLMRGADDRIALAAAREILDRGLGKPAIAATINIDAGDGLLAAMERLGRKGLPGDNAKVIGGGAA